MKSGADFLRALGVVRPDAGEREGHESATALTETSGPWRGQALEGASDTGTIPAKDGAVDLTPVAPSKSGADRRSSRATFAQVMAAGLERATSLERAPEEQATDGDPFTRLEAVAEGIPVVAAPEPEQADKFVPAASAEAPAHEDQERPRLLSVVEPIGQARPPWSARFTAPVGLSARELPERSQPVDDFREPIEFSPLSPQHELPRAEIPGEPIEQMNVDHGTTAGSWLVSEAHAEPSADNSLSRDRGVWAPVEDNMTEIVAPASADLSARDVIEEIPQATTPRYLAMPPVGAKTLQAHVRSLAQGREVGEAAQPPPGSLPALVPHEPPAPLAAQDSATVVPAELGLSKDEILAAMFAAPPSVPTRPAVVFQSESTADARRGAHVPSAPPRREPNEIQAGPSQPRRERVAPPVDVERAARTTVAATVAREPFPTEEYAPEAVAGMTLPEPLAVLPGKPVRIEAGASQPQREPVAPLVDVERAAPTAVAATAAREPSPTEEYAPEAVAGMTLHEAAAVPSGKAVRIEAGASQPQRERVASPVDVARAAPTVAAPTVAEATVAAPTVAAPTVARDPSRTEFAPDAVAGATTPPPVARRSDDSPFPNHRGRRQAPVPAPAAAVVSAPATAAARAPAFDAATSVFTPAGVATALVPGIAPSAGPAPAVHTDQVPRPQFADRSSAPETSESGAAATDPGLPPGVPVSSTTARLVLPPDASNRPAFSQAPDAPPFAPASFTKPGKPLPVGPALHHAVTPPPSAPHLAALASVAATPDNQTSSRLTSANPTDISPSPTGFASQPPGESAREPQAVLPVFGTDAATRSGAKSGQASNHPAPAEPPTSHARPVEPRAPRVASEPSPSSPWRESGPSPNEREAPDTRSRGAGIPGGIAATSDAADGAPSRSGDVERPAPRAASAGARTLAQPAATRAAIQHAQTAQPRADRASETVARPPNAEPDPLVPLVEHELPSAATVPPRYALAETPAQIIAPTPAHTATPRGPIVSPISTLSAAPFAIAAPPSTTPPNPSPVVASSPTPTLASVPSPAPAPAPAPELRRVRAAVLELQHRLPLKRNVARASIPDYVPPSSPPVFGTAAPTDKSPAPKNVRPKNETSPSQSADPPPSSSKTPRTTASVVVAETEPTAAIPPQAAHRAVRSTPPRPLDGDLQLPAHLLAGTRRPLPASAPQESPTRKSPASSEVPGTPAAAPIGHAPPPPPARLDDRSLFGAVGPALASAPFPAPSDASRDGQGSRGSGAEQQSAHSRLPVIGRTLPEPNPPAAPAVPFTLPPPPLAASLDSRSFGFVTPPSPNGEATPLMHLAAEDPSLHAAALGKNAHVRLETEKNGDLSLHLLVRDGVVDVRFDGTAARTLDLRPSEIRTALAGEGITLGTFEAAAAASASPSFSSHQNYGGSPGSGQNFSDAASGAGGQSSTISPTSSQSASASSPSSSSPGGSSFGGGAGAGAGGGGNARHSDSGPADRWPDRTPPDASGRGGSAASTTTPSSTTEPRRRRGFHVTA